MFEVSSSKTSLSMNVCLVLDLKIYRPLTVKFDLFFPLPVFADLSYSLETT
jgi:hypothetical protein